MQLLRSLQPKISWLATIESRTTMFDFIKKAMLTGVGLSAMSKNNGKELMRR
jgi:hypothetical protein